jgi:RNA polymerase sigma factor (sigma-70 family)
VQRTQIIPAAEQVALCRRAQAGDRAARDALVVASMGLVYSVAKCWVRSAPGLELDDLAAEGVFGLLRAIEKFDCDRGIKFATYAVHWIKHAVRTAHDDDSGLKRGDTARSALVRDVRALVTAGESREHAIAVVAARTRSRPTTVRAVIEAFERGRPRSLDAPVGGTDGGTLLDVLPADAPDPEEQLGAAEHAAVLREAVARAVDDLPARERAIVERRLMRTGEEDEATLAELGAELSVSRERVRQIEGEVLDRLRQDFVPAFTGVLFNGTDRPDRAIRPAELPPRPQPALRLPVRVPAPAAVQPAPPLRPVRVVGPDRKRRGGLCRICGKRLRRHNRHGVCHAHGRSRTFDAATGRCAVCGVVVADPAQRGAHAIWHGIAVQTDSERKAKQRASHKRLRAARRAQGHCEGCGGTRSTEGRLCAGCLAGARARSESLRRRNGCRARRPVLLTCGGETLPLAEWARRTGIGVKVLWHRLVVTKLPPERVLEPVRSAGARRRQKPTCVNGHARTPENLYTSKRGSRHCRECGRQRCRDRRARARERAQLELQSLRRAS